MLACAALVIFAVATGRTTALSSLRALEAGRDLATPLSELHARLYGDAFARGIADLRRSIPEDQPYVLVRVDGPDDGPAYWVRYELAPRPVVYIDATHSSGPSWRRLVPRGMPIVLVSPGSDRPPVQIDRAQLASLLSRNARGPTPEISNAD
jgi:hypothetical protein